MQDWYRDGIPIWWDESERVAFDAIARVSKSRAATQRAEESASSGKKKAVPGRYFIAEPRLIEGDEMPTRGEWLEEQARKAGNKSVSSKFGNDNKGNIKHGRK